MPEGPASTTTAAAATAAPAAPEPAAPHDTGTFVRCPPKTPPPADTADAGGLRAKAWKVALRDSTLARSPVGVGVRMVGEVRMCGG